MENERHTPQGPDTDTPMTTARRASFDLEQLIRPRSPDELAAMDTDAQAREEDRTQAALARKKTEYLQSLARQTGPRYAKCTLESFQCSTPHQRNVKHALEAYLEDSVEQLANGAGIVLFGPPGTGKDHLLIGLARAILKQHARPIHWVRGADLWSASRDRINNGPSESAFLAQYTSPCVLILSDPSPASGALSQYESTLLYRMVDARYHALKPTWLTINVRSGADADSLLGTPVCDRLRDGALVAYCNWPTYRKPAIHVKTTASR